MRHIIQALFAILAISATALATPLSTDQLAKELGHLQGFKKLNADFVQTRFVSDWGAEIRTTGQFSIQTTPEEIVLWEILTPSYTAMRMKKQRLDLRTDTNKGSWQAIDNKKMQEQMRNVFAWLGMNLKSLEKDFEISKTKEREFRLVPKNKKSIFKNMDLFLGPSKQINKIVMHESSSDRIQILFANTRIVK